MTLKRTEKELALNGGMDTKQSTELAAETTLRAVDNLRWNALGELAKRPTYASTVTPAPPAGADYSSAAPEALFSRGSEVFALTRDMGVCTVDPTDPTSVVFARSDIGVASTVAYEVVKYAPRACKVSRRFLERSQYGNTSTYIQQAVSAVYGDHLVVAWIEVNQSSAKIKVKAVHVDTGTVLSTVQYAIASGYHGIPGARGMSAIPYLVSGSEGVLVTYATGIVAPYTISAITYNASTREFAAAGDLTTNAKFVSHALANEYSGDKFYFAFCDNTTGRVKAQYRSTGAVTTTHSGSTSGGKASDPRFFAFVVHSAAVLLCSSTTAGKAYCEVFGTPADQAELLSQANEGFWGVTASAQDTADREAVMYVNAYDATASPDTFGVRAVAVDFSTTTPALIWRQIVPNTWLAGSAFSLDGRSYCPFILEPLTVGTSSVNTSVILGRCYLDASETLMRIDAVARIGHDRFFSMDSGIFGGQATTSVAGNKVHMVFTADASSDDVDIGATEQPAPQSIFHATVTFPDESLPLPYFQRGQVTCIASGVSLEWDGDVLYEHALLCRPRISVVVSNALGSAGALTKVGTVMTYTGGAIRWPDNIVGRTVTFTGSTSPANDGPFVVTARVSDTVISFTNAAGVAEAFAGTWATDATNVVASGVVSVCAKYKFVDCAGNLHESEISETVDTADIAVNSELRVYVSKPPFVGLDGSTTQAIDAEVYLTEGDGTTYYLANTADSVKAFDGTSSTSSYWWIFDGLGDGDPADPELRTTGTSGSELLPEPPPAFRHWAIIGDRAWGIDAEDSTRVWPSKPIVAGYGIEWNTANTFFIGDDLKAVADVGGVPTFFAENGVWQVFGDGPDERGQGFFSPARRMPFEASCIDSDVCRTPMGVVFRGRRGLYLLGGQGLEPLGLPIDPETRSPTLAGHVWTRVVYDEPHSEIRVLDATHDRLWVFNLVERKWSEWRQDDAAQRFTDMVTCDGRVWYVHDGTAIRREYGVDESGWNVSTEGWSITTPRIRLDGVIGDGRLYKLGLQLKPSTSVGNVATLTCSIGVNSELPEGNTSSHSWTGANLSQLTSGLPFELRAEPGYQRCKTLELTLSETCTSAYGGTSPIAARLDLGIDGKMAKRVRAAAQRGAA